MATEIEIRDWMEGRGYRVFEATRSGGGFRIMAEKDGQTIRASDDAQLGWHLTDATPIPAKPRGAYVTARSAHSILTQRSFNEAVDAIEAERGRSDQRLQLLQIALDPNDDRASAHEEECCGVVLDTWSMDLGEFGLGTDDDGRWVTCISCGKTGRHYDGEGWRFCIRSIAGAKPAPSQ